MKPTKLNQMIICFFSIFCINHTTTQAQLELISNQQIDFSNAISTIASGNWNDASIWSTNTVPTGEDDVIIENNHLVYIDKQGVSSGQIVDLCRNLQIKQTARVSIGHDTDNFAKDLRIKGSILCNGTFSAGRNQPGNSGDGSIYKYNSRIYLNISDQTTFISGAGYFHPKSLIVSSSTPDVNLVIDHYNLKVDDTFNLKSNNRINCTIETYSYLNIGGTFGFTGGTYQYSSPTAKSNVTVKGIVITDDVSLFTKNTTIGDTSSLTITQRGVVHTQKINNDKLDKKTEAAGFVFNIENGGLFKLGEGINFYNLTLENPNFTLNNDGEVRYHYSETLSTKAEITAKIDEKDPNLGNDVSQIIDVFGASHIAGWYNYTTRPFLLEGLDKYKEFGSSAIKTTLTAENGKMFNAYPFNHTWPKFNTLKEVAQHQFVDSLFKRNHIKTHTFWTTSKNKGDWKKGPDYEHASFLNEEQQFYDLTKHLLETYGSTNKRFVYQNWEGDWMLRGQGVNWEENPSLIPDHVEWDIEGMARMFRARQRGTERARKEFENSTEKVYAGIEFNKLWWNDNGVRKTMMDSNTPCVIADVVSKTRIDIASWSAYDGGWTNNDNPHGHAMWKGLEMARYFISETKELYSEFPVQIGEFAINENPPYNGNNTESVIRQRYGRYIGVALGLNIPQFFLWNLYCSGQQGAPEGFTWEKGVQYENDFLYEWMDGKWLLEPDESWGHAANFLMEQWQDSLSTDEQETEKIRIYPNPAKDIIYLENIPDQSIVIIYNSLGKIIYQEKHHSRELSVKNLSRGIYYLKIILPTNNTKTEKLIIN